MMMLWYSVFWFYILFRTDSKKEHLDLRHCYGNFLEVTGWKLLDQSYVWSSFSTITNHISNCILKDVFKLQILQTQINIRANLPWPIIMKLISSKVLAKLPLAQKVCTLKNISLTWKMTFHLFLYASVSLQET